MADARALLAETLKPLVPKNWRIIPYRDSLDALDQPTLMVRLDAIEKLPAAPITQHWVSGTLVIMAPFRDSQKAEDALDDYVSDLLFAMDSISWLTWSRATRSFDQNNPGWDIPFQFATTK